MTLTDPFTGQIAAKPDFQRDRYGRPLIVPRGETKPVPYQRASSIAKPIEDGYALELWGKRMVAYGMLDRSIQARLHAVGGTPHDWDQPTKTEVNRICEDALQAAKAHQAADIGTAVHRMVERINLGETVDGGPYEADLEAYRAATLRFHFLPSLVECRLACDELKAAGTCDVVVQVGSKLYAADLKTGTTIEYALLAYAAQLAVYANSDLYNPVDHSRTPLDVSTEIGYLIHLPAGQGRCTIYEVDLIAGYKAAKLANTVRRARTAAKGFATKVHEVTA